MTLAGFISTVKLLVKQKAGIFLVSDSQFLTTDSLHCVHFNLLLLLCFITKLLNTAQCAHNYKTTEFVTVCAFGIVQ